MSYIDNVLKVTQAKNAGEIEFLQAVKEVFDSLSPIIDRFPEIERNGILERLVEPERLIIFSVPWVDDSGCVRVNRGIRVQHNGALGPYKGGLRFHPSVNQSVLKFLAFEQTFKNALTGFPMGGGKGGSDFDPKGKSDREVMAFCQSFMSELCKHIGADLDVPAGDIGVGAREVGYMFGQYRRIRNIFEGGVLTGKGLSYGGALGRKEATGYGLLYLVDVLLKDKKQSIEGKRVVVSGAGNVAIYAAQKAMEMGAVVVAMSDSNGFIYDKNGIDLQEIKQIKEVRRGRIKEYVLKHPHAEYHEDGTIWQIACDIALPCATQNELNKHQARLLIDNKCMVVAEGANMPCTPEAVEALQRSGVYYLPGKASNAGGVSVSALEMSQNSMRLSYTFEEIDSKLKSVMTNIYERITEASSRVNKPDDFLVGANLAGFLRVLEAMLAQGVI